ncbi:MAG: SDR family NAD(P)-dependent oxidoreductase [Dehalococcoidia bacterium]|nr:SDR family NAD(P)-dependent oxidoreductase [Dehalococcoidia bacterium]
MSVLEQFDLTGTCAIVTGAGINLGKVIALHLARAGANIVGMGSRAQAIDDVGVEVRDRGRQFLGISGCDVTNSVMVQNMVEARRERNSGQLTSWSIMQERAAADREDPARTHGRRLAQRDGLQPSPRLFCIRAVVPQMITPVGNGNQHLLGGGVAGDPGNWMYPVAKAAVIQLTKATAATNATENIRAVCIAPGRFPSTNDP